MAPDCDDDGGAGFESGYRSPVISQPLAAELGVATVLGAQQPVAGDPAALLSQLGLKRHVALACPAPKTFDRGRSRWRRLQREVPARHRGGPYSALDQLALPQLLNTLASPLLSQQVAVVKEGGKLLEVNVDANTGQINSTEETNAAEEAKEKAAKGKKSKGEKSEKNEK